MMKKEAIDIGGLLGDGICAIVGAETAGAGYGACAELKKGIQSAISGTQGVVQNAVQSGERSPDIVKEGFEAYQELSNLLRIEGATDPKYTNPKLLQEFFEGPSGGNMLAYNGPEGALKIAKALKSFIASEFLVEASYPDFIQKSMDWVFNYYKRSGFDINGTLQQLEKLQNEATDPEMTQYVINVINNNYVAAILWKLMMSDPNKDLKAVGETLETAVKVLGKQSPEVLNIQDAINQTAKATFDQLALSRKVYNFHLDFAIERAEVKRELIRRGGGLMENLLNTDIAHLINKYSPIFGALGRDGVAGQSLSQLGKKT